MSGLTGLILIWHDDMSFGNNAGKFDDTKYVMLFFISSLQVTVTEMKDGWVHWRCWRHRKRKARQQNNEAAQTMVRLGTKMMSGMQSPLLSWGVMKAISCSGNLSLLEKDWRHTYKHSKCQILARSLLLLCHLACDIRRRSCKHRTAARRQWNIRLHLARIEIQEL